MANENTTHPGLEKLITKGAKNGFVTFDDINAELPDDLVSPDSGPIQKFHDGPVPYAKLSGQVGLRKESFYFFFS